MSYNTWNVFPECEIRVLNYVYIIRIRCSWYDKHIIISEQTLWSKTYYTTTLDADDAGGMIGVKFHIM